MWRLADGQTDAKHSKVIIGNSGRAVEYVELLVLVFFLASTTML